MKKLSRAELRQIISESGEQLDESRKPDRQELDLTAERVAHALDTVSRVVNRLLEMDFGESSEEVYREGGDAVASLQRVMVAVKKKRDSTPTGYRDDIGTRLDQYRLDQKRLARRGPRRRK